MSEKLHRDKIAAIKKQQGSLETTLAKVRTAATKPEDLLDGLNDVRPHVDTRGAEAQPACSRRRGTGQASLGFSSAVGFGVL